MNAPDRFHFSNFTDNQEFESIRDYDELYDWGINEIPDQFWDEMAVDDADEFFDNDV